jgi:hypothetical protein
MYQLLKLNHRKDSHVAKEDAVVQELEVLDGHFIEPIEIGRCFKFASTKGLLYTSIVRSIYIHGTDNDKLVLPSEFDYAAEDIAAVEFREKDVMFATGNSVYLLREVHDAIHGGEQRVLGAGNGTEQNGREVPEQDRQL